MGVVGRLKNQLDIASLNLPFNKFKMFSKNICLNTSKKYIKIRFLF